MSITSLKNRKLWESHIADLPLDQFTQKIEYSIGSVYNHIIHLVNVDNAWFSGLRGVSNPDFLDPAAAHDRAEIRARWDRVERDMRAYLDGLQDNMLFSAPLTDEEDKDLILWQVLLHVANHGTDHRAQLLRILNDMDRDTGPQDFVFYIYDHA